MTRRAGPSSRLVVIVLAITALIAALTAVAVVASGRGSHHTRRAAAPSSPKSAYLIPNAGAQSGADRSFSVVKAGHTSGVAWRLERADGDFGTTCWRWIATPALNYTPGCIPPPGSRAAADQVQFLAFGSGRGNYDALAVAIPDGATRLTIGYVGGRIQQAQVSPIFVWVGPPSPLPAFLAITMKDGTEIQCGAGAISATDDLKDPSLVATIPGAPWGCLPD